MLPEKAAGPRVVGLDEADPSDRPVAAPGDGDDARLADDGFYRAERVKRGRCSG
jgi:hypothetical protein